ncbi:peptidylprolyl isomerase [Candidatus Nitrosocosmicus sp. FF01]|uniref:peptidylprolyl isomerase n=1 Tax=Candidatus Nitrosocosmicus sp. FF01 TaxID=3397670 RepID=UPI0039EABFAF
MAGIEFFKSERNRKITKYLLIIAVLCLAFSIAFILRAYPIKYGFYLNEFDPFFDYRATEYIVNNGVVAYFDWHDYKSWYPDGRDIAGTSQSGLHLTAATLYQIFGLNMTLMDFTIWFPVVIGSASTVLMFLLVRVITGNTIPGLIAALFFAVSPAIIQRGNLGWFKSEPLGLFYGLGGTYLFLSALKDKKYKYFIPKAIVGGILVGLAVTSWGGSQYFVIPIGIFIIVLGFISKDLKNNLIVAALFTISVISVAGAFPRPGMSFVIGLPGILLMTSTLFLFVTTIVRLKTSEKRATLKTAAVLGIFVIIGISIVAGGFYKTPSFRYLNAINPFLSAENKLVESVAEHFTPTIVDYFRQFSVLIIFAGLGIWLAFKNKSNSNMIFALIIGLTGIYISATFARLLVFASLSIIILSSIGIYQSIRSITSIRTEYEQGAISPSSSPSKDDPKIRKEMKMKMSKQVLPYMGFVTILIIMLTIPMVYDSNTNWITSADVPTSIANGGTNYRLTTNDWIETLDWISENTPEDSVITSWWDYGYWITTLGNRTSIADNATINQTRIETIAKMFISPEEEGWKIANNLKSDYILIYVVGQKLPSLDPANPTPLYVLGSGGDESKKHWFIRIGGFNESEYVESNGDTPKQKYWDSLLGNMMPFKTIGYFNPSIGTLSPTYQPNAIPFYTKDIKYPKGNTEEPLSLEYASKSFESNDPGLFFGVLLYKVNQNYSSTVNSTAANFAATNGNNNQTDGSNASISQSNILNNIDNTTSSSNNMTTTTNATATIETTQGPIKIEFYPDVAPNHVKNFQDLASKGFYDGIVFHRIVPGFVIQAGDPNTKNDSASRESWGTGGPGYTINQEFNNMPHERGVLSMARTNDPNSAGSQFFIVLNDSNFLDNQYTVFGKVTEGLEIVDKIANSTTNSMDQPQDPNSARITKITIQ